jgi:hypothetical protein
MPGMHGTLRAAAFAGSLLLAADAAAACRASASGAFSFETRLTPGPARVCRMTVDVFEGRACGATPKWKALLPCDQTEHMAISDRGRLISILAPVVKRRDLNVLRVTWSADRWAWVTLDKLAQGKPAFKLPLKLSFEGDALKVAADRTIVIPFETVRQMASVLPD